MATEKLILDRWLYDNAYAEEINVHVTYGSYFKRLAQLLDTMIAGDELFIVGWGLHVGTEMYGIPGNKPKTLLNYLEELNSRGVRIRLLLTAGGQKEKENKLAIQALNDLKGRGEKSAYIDSQLHPMSDHHQKAVFISRKKYLPILFVGGMDINDQEARVSWVDSQVEISGPAALLGLNSLEERWNSVESPTVKKISPFVNYEKVMPNVSGFTTQFLRTYSPVYKKGDLKKTPTIKRNFATDGEYSYFNIVKQAIINSKKSIYQEDQFFTPMGNRIQKPNPTYTSRYFSDRSSINGDSLDPLIYEKANDSSFKYVGIGQNYFDKNFPSFFKHKKSRKDATEFPYPALLTLNLPFGQYLVKPPFVHSKLWIFDDELVIVGSANYWNSSFNKNDDFYASELGVAFTSSKANGEIFGFSNVSYIHGLRLKLWERMRQFAEPGFRYTEKQVGNFDDEFRIFTGDFIQGDIRQKLFIPMPSF